MKKALCAVGAFALTLIVLFLPAPASAEPTTRCKSVAVTLTGRDDTGTGGHVWAKDTMTRTLTVCLDNEVHPTRGKAYYVATVVDKGTFVTQSGKTPRGEAGLPAGVTGTVNGGFRVPKFTGPVALELTAPPARTSTGQWVAEAVKDAEDVGFGVYRWSYKNACESYVDNNGKYTGDITSRCVTPENPTYTKPTCTAFGIVKLPKQDGVKYTGKRVDGKAVVTATAEKGYLFPKDAKDTWAYDVAILTGAQCEPSPTPTTGEPTPTPTATGTASPQPPTGTATPTPSASTVPAALPVTGSRGNPALYLGLAGLAAVTLGAAAVLLVRRRIAS